MDYSERLTEKQRQFCEYYLINGNGAESAKLAGYKESYTKQAGRDILSRPIVRRELEKMRQKLSSENIMTAEKVLEELTVIALTDKNTFARLKALELLGKRYKLFTDNIEIESKQVPQFLDDRVVEYD